jgi:hypothetical protein
MTDQSKSPLARYTIRGAEGMEFLKWPASVEPKAGTIAVVGGEGWQTAGIFKEGRWVRQNGQPFKRTVTFWITMERVNG